MFDLNKYRQHLSTQWLGQSVCFFEKIDSTNSFLKNLQASDVSHGQICLADYQTKGRGQYERNWQSCAAQNLTFTLAFCPPKAERFHVLTLACARAVVAQIEKEFQCSACIKWPNDILMNGKKITGILTEAVFNGNKPDRLLVGIGINVNQERFKDDLKYKASSVKNEIGRSVDREYFLANLLSRIEFEYTRWHKQNDDLLKWINKKIAGYGRWVGLRVNGNSYSEKFKLLGVDRSGKLAVIDYEGGIKTFSHEQIRVVTD